MLWTRRIGLMSDRDRRGMWIKNTGDEDVQVVMEARTIRLAPGEEGLLTPEEVRDDTLRQALQERSISIVRPATEEEDDDLQERLDADNE